MDILLMIIAIATCGYLVITAIDFVIGFRRLYKLTRQDILPTEQLPSISIIFSALNEEADIAAALTTMLKLNYPHLEIIALNDRSTDKTPAILDELSQRYKHLRVYHINDLPPDWFGKNHALQLGAQHAKSDWLLFTDADVRMKPDALSKAISYAINHHLDHLTICEHHLRQTFGLKILLLGNYLTYSMAFRPWRIRQASSNKSLGHGAFNLVKASSYHACGGHAAIAMECLDDLKLGALIKNNGYQQDTVDGRDYIEREWYSSLPDMIAGWKKNTFAYFDYQLLSVTRDTLLAVTFFIWPCVAIIMCSGLVWWMNAINICLTLFISAYVARQFRLEQRYAIFYPFSIGLLIYSIWNSVVTIYANKGVVWRGTHYSLDRLRGK